MMGESAKARRRVAILQRFPVGNQLAALVERVEWLSQEVARATGSAVPNDDFAKLVEHIATVKKTIKKPKGER